MGSVIIKQNIMEINDQKRKHGRYQSTINYKSYDEVVAILAVIPLRFHDYYTEDMFNTTVKCSISPSAAIHPIISITRKTPICKVISEFRKQSPEEVREYEEKFSVIRNEIEQKIGHILTWCKFGGMYSGQCCFTCGFCGAENQSSTIQCLRKPTAIGRCIICMNWSNYDDLCADFEANKNFTMAMTRDAFYAQYKINSKCIQLTVRCKCEDGSIFTSWMTALKSGGTQGCNACRNARCATTSLERYGVPSPMQHPDVLEKQTKSAYKLKLYVLPSGKNVYLQGYEYDALLHLIGGSYICGWDPTFVFTEKNLLITKHNVGSISYMFQGDTHSYFPDFQIMNTDIYIEVKSTYTIFADFDVNLAKFKAVCNIGSRITIIIMDDKNKTNINFTELDDTNIDIYVSKMLKMREYCRTRTVNEFRQLYDSM